MKHDTPTPSATSLPRAPRDDADRRLLRYIIMMSVRVVCFVLMVVVTPYGWYTIAFAVGAAVLPYIAVVIANVGLDNRESTAVDPARALTAPPTEAPAASAPPVIEIRETRPES